MEEDEVQLQEEELENDHTLKTKVDLNCSKRFRSRFFFSLKSTSKHGKTVIQTKEVV